MPPFNARHILIAATLTAGVGLGAWLLTHEPHGHAHDAPGGHGHEHGPGHGPDGGHAAEEAERGPRGGRLLRSGDFAVEITIVEDGVPPRFQVYATQDGKPVDARSVQLAIELTRLGGRVDRFAFQAQGDHLAGQGTVAEPHSFDVRVAATHAGRSHSWTYASYEGRTQISAAAAEASAIAVEAAGPAILQETVEVTGRIALNRDRVARVQARFPGLVREVRKGVGDAVAAGDVLALVESNESLQSYAVKAPIGGVVLVRATNAGAVAGDAPLFEMADLSTVWADLHVFPRDAARLAAGQAVTLQLADGSEAEALLDRIHPVAEAGSQTVVARAVLPNRDGRWRPGQAVTGRVAVAVREVPLAVRTSALQRFRDFSVVFAQVGETYEVRMLELGQRAGDRVEVLGGLQPGERYVTGNSFLVKADIEKSGASHDH